MTVVLAIDAGGSHTRAACVDAKGTVLGWGRASGGNATSLGEGGVRAIETAARAAITEAAADASTLTAVLCAAGEAPVGRLGELAERVGMHDSSSWHPVGDALGAYFSGSSAPDGIVLIAGTGAIAARVQNAQVVSVVDGLGWLLGDAGSGFWIGREVVSAVAAAADGRGSPTALTEQVFSRIGGATACWSGVRTPDVAAILRAVYDRPPTALAEFAPLAFDAAAEDDAVAASIVSAAASHLATTIETARRGHENLPVVVSGSVLTEGMLRAGVCAGALLEVLQDADLRPATDGVVGAAILALRRRGVEVSEQLRVTMAEQVELRRA